MRFVEFGGFGYFVILVLFCFYFDSLVILGVFARLGHLMLFGGFSLDFAGFRILVLNLRVLVMFMVFS